MPLGDVSLKEFGDTVVSELVSGVSYLTDDKVVFFDPDDDEDPDQLRKHMGISKEGVAVTPGDPEMEVESAFSNRVELIFHLNITVLYRKIDNVSSKLDDDDVTGRNVTDVIKDVINELQGNRMSLFNRTGVACGPVRDISEGGSLQAKQFIATGRSRESRS